MREDPALLLPPDRRPGAGRTLVILPALNEEECLAGVLRELARTLP